MIICDRSLQCVAKLWTPPQRFSKKYFSHDDCDKNTFSNLPELLYIVSVHVNSYLGPDSQQCCSAIAVRAPGQRLWDYTTRKTCYSPTTISAPILQPLGAFSLCPGLSTMDPRRFLLSTRNLSIDIWKMIFAYHNLAHFHASLFLICTVKGMCIPNHCLEPCAYLFMCLGLDQALYRFKSTLYDLTGQLVQMETHFIV